MGLYSDKHGATAIVASTGWFGIKDYLDHDPADTRNLKMSRTPHITFCLGWVWGGNVNQSVVPCWMMSVWELIRNPILVPSYNPEGNTHPAEITNNLETRFPAKIKDRIRDSNPIPLAPHPNGLPMSIKHDPTIIVEYKKIHCTQ